MKQNFFTLKTLLGLPILLFGFLTGCATSPPGIQMSIQSANYLNPDINGRASPVVVKVYQLKTPYAFKNATFSTLVRNATVGLGNNLIDLNNFEIRPNEQKNLHLILNNNTKYLGFVAEYRSINNGNWRAIVHVVGKQKSVHVKLILASQGLSAQ